MGLKKLGVFLFLIVLFLGFSSAESCRVTERFLCSESEYIIMGLSSNTNAHGELVSQGNYDYVLCCDFEGTPDCTGLNKIIGLFSETNAHAEIPNPESPEYKEKVCYGGLECKSFDGGCGEDYGIAMLSLSDEINAHLGEFADYPIKICCKIDKTPLAYWGDGSGTSVDEISIEVGKDSVWMFLVNSESEEGDSVSFEIYDYDWSILDEDEYITTITGIVDSDKNVKAEWLINQTDLDATEEEDSYEFYFIVDEVKSNDLIINILEEGFCFEKSFCMDYKTQSECEDDDCEIVIENIKVNDVEVICGEEVYNELTKCHEERNCRCFWDDEKECGSGYEVVITKCDNGGPARLTAGVCLYKETTEDDCEDGFLSYSWTGNWIWDEANSFPIDPKNEDYVKDGEVWRYNPKNEEGERMSDECVGGENMVPCAAQVQLDFFGVYSLIIAVGVIILIYILVSKKKKKKNKTR